ncbi:sensor histidine kinase [Bradyrhizobium sp.]|jgi:signal transduction histidine kinase|uniref:sensor histidine kinase n=1 Tax=Bradyrhizobium sp. TaxID=376 RepID=UPI00391A0733
MTEGDTQVRPPAEVGVGAEPTGAHPQISITSRLAAMIALGLGPTGYIRSAALPLVTAVLTLAIFIVDTVTPYEIPAATFYVVVVLLSLRFCREQGVITVSAICVVLTIVSYVLTPGGNFETGIISTGISLLALAATTYLAVKIESARITAQQAQAHLAHVARITTLGEIAASIAHEVNQPLAAIVTHANACTRWIHAQPSDLEKAAASIESIVDDANRASEIIHRIRAFVTRAEPKRDWIDINGVIDEVLALMQTQFRENQIDLRTNLANSLPKIFGDRIQLQQVVLNLLVNGIDAINAAPNDDREISVGSSKSAAHSVTITIADSGVGIDPASVNSLFDAFHSTKSEGMGIGLSICRSIIEAHGGQIWAAPNKPRGAIFCFTLPADGERML